MKQLSLYLWRWQASGIIMIPVMYLLSSYFPIWVQIILTNLLGGIAFFMIDRKIFSLKDK